MPALLRSLRCPRRQALAQEGNGWGWVVARSLEKDQSCFLGPRTTAPGNDTVWGRRATIYYSFHGIIA